MACRSEARFCFGAVFLQVGRFHFGFGSGSGFAEKLGEPAGFLVFFFDSGGVAAADAIVVTDTSSSDTATTGEFQKELACSSADAFEEMKKEMGQMPKVHEDLYLSRSGRVLGIQDRMVMLGKKSPQALVYVSRLKMHDYGQPKFTLNAATQPTVSLWQLIKEAQAPEESIEAEQAAADAEAAADAAVFAATEAVAAKPVKAKKAKAKKAKAKKVKS